MSKRTDTERLDAAGMHLTADYLAAHRYCADGVARFRARHPDGVEVTAEWLREEGDLWLLSRILVVPPYTGPRERVRRAVAAYRALDETYRAWRKADDEASHTYATYRAYAEAYRACDEAFRARMETDRALDEADRDAFYAHLATGTLLDAVGTEREG